MPEGDAVWRTARRLHDALAGQVIRVADLRWPNISTADLSGRTTLQVVPHGKHLLHRIEGGLTLHSHLRMEGRWSVAPSPGLAASRRNHPDLRALVATSEWTALGLRLGLLGLVPTAREVTIVGHLGPDLLGSQWNPDAAVERLLAADDLIGAALLDQRNLAGLGTMWASEALFLARINPWQQPREVGPDRLGELVEHGRVLLEQSIGRRPSGSRFDPPPAGRRGHPGQQFHVYDRERHPCRRCGGRIRRGIVGTAPRDRQLFYCTGCQPMRR